MGTKHRPEGYCGCGACMIDAFAKADFNSHFSFGDDTAKEITAEIERLKAALSDETTMGQTRQYEIDLAQNALDKAGYDSSKRLHHSIARLETRCHKAERLLAESKAEEVGSTNEDGDTLVARRRLTDEGWVEVPGRPHRAVEVDIHIGADDMTWAVRRLVQMATSAEERGKILCGASGSPDAGTSIDVAMRPEQTSEKYHAELLAYLEARRGAEQSKEEASDGGKS